MSLATDTKAGPIGYATFALLKVTIIHLDWFEEIASKITSNTIQVDFFPDHKISQKFGHLRTILLDDQPLFPSPIN